MSYLFWIGSSFIFPPAIAAIASDESPACCDECCDWDIPLCAEFNWEAASKDEREGTLIFDALNV